MTTTSTRLSKQARREQLLDTALAIVRAEGADGLTLPTLAEAAGVSRPIVYDHFRTRPGLLLALYRRLDERQRAATAQALREAAPTAAELARVTSTAYFACAADMPEFNAISAALKGNPDMEAIQHEMYDSYADLMADALLPHSGLPADALRLRCVGVLGAAEAIATELNRERTTVAEAIAALTDLIVGSLDAGTDC
ncbi:TetR/AcrR family transcriptional regulator [Streptomyces gardneri]|uniref:TetR/AcrR family transcriptional regulator n=1 Tax=Nocardia TaxID=1817 RepID=UPI001359465E|nr:MULTISPECIES: TetR/AcrR family transcriptional regulator [Nocardia]MBF6168006.1 TetR/AcrR family transcriptional regulator [Streptomyces gardneri]MBF6206785.1 TetR/AcrR family transcriptional regulator [Streptomyces gardneri]UAK32792.1 TetR/AcrR family transcriptional regulator [Nocardia asteroides]